MVQISAEIPDFSSISKLPLYYTVDRVKGQGPVIVFCGPSTITNETKSASRIQAYIFTSFGFRSYPRLTITPISELYEAVNHLLPEHRGDEIKRGLAGALHKYYLDVHAQHDASVAGHIASSMTAISPTEGVVHDLECALQPQHISHVEVDVILPTGSSRSGAWSSLIESMGVQLAGYGRAPVSSATSLDASSLKQQVNEFYETEIRYIEKLQRLVDVARELRKGPPSECLELFPQALDRILQAHKNADITHTQGITALSKTLVEHLPKFSSCYGEYFESRTQMKHDTAIRIVRESVVLQQPRYANDRLEDLFIEPVQRLPRFTLYIEKFLSILPPTHPAVALLQKAQAKVTAICSVGESPDSTVLRRLKSLIGPWPSDFHPKGRLIAIAEAQEVKAPFTEVDRPMQDGQGMLLLFPGCLVEVNKGVNSTLTAYALRQTLERPDILSTPPQMKSSGASHRSKPELAFRGWIALNDLRASFSSSGKDLQLVIPKGLNDCAYERSRPTVQIHRMRGQYEGRANKWTEELAKATILGRAPTFNDNWELRQMRTHDSSLTILFALSERESPGARIRLGIGLAPGTESRDRAETSITLTETSDPALYEVRVQTVDDTSRAHVGISNFPTYFMRVLSATLRDRFIASNQTTNNALASHNLKILKSLSIPETATKRYRPPSPTKLLSNFGSIKASFLSRSKSDVGRPGSAGGPNSSRPGSSDSNHPFNLASLPPAATFHVTPTAATPSPSRKKKRRSSLSDLVSLNRPDDDTPSSPERRPAPPTSVNTKEVTAQRRKPSGPRERSKKMEALFEQLNVENELLYERYNSELLGLAKAARFGEANKALTEKLNTAQRELASLRAENMKLKRRIVELEDLK
ncbi:MAG: hypothetical protein M1814_006598 [Vezdaea aestivalis]|nr:MAG: hypothetical protein M1814_006598 [Vezdaea aestivalis]